MEIERVAVILDQKNGLTPTEIREFMNSKQDKFAISKIEIKVFLTERLQDNHQFCLFKKKNDSVLVFPQSLVLKT